MFYSFSSTSITQLSFLLQLDHQDQMEIKIKNTDYKYLFYLFPFGLGMDISN